MPPDTTTSLARLVLATALERELPDFESKLRVRQAVSLAKQAPVHAAANLGNGAIMAWLFWDRLPHPPILAWLGLLVGASILQIVGWRRRHGRPAPERIGRGAIQAAARRAFLLGALWGAAAFYAFPSADDPLRLAVVFVIGGLCAGAVGSMAMQPIACAAFILSALSPVILRLVLEGGSSEGAMAAMLALYLGLLVASLANGFSSFVELVRAKAESRSLASGLAVSTAAHRTKAQFLSNMSHELRTPLNAIIGFSGMIRDEMLGPVGTPHYRDYARDIHASGEHLLAIVDSVLDLSRLEANELKLDESELNVATLIHEVVGLLIQRARHVNVNLSVAPAGDLPALFADGQRVKKILLNLLTNAVKFSNPGGEVSIGASLRDDGRLAIQVADGGIGMSDEELERIRAPFSQVDETDTRRYGGVGIGLALADKLAKLHGACIELESFPGIGTTATVVFPRSRRVAARAHEPSALVA